MVVKKKVVEDTKIFLKKKKKKNSNIIVNVTKICKKMKIKSLLSIEKNITEWEKKFYVIIRKFCFLRKVFLVFFCFFQALQINKLFYGFCFGAFIRWNIRKAFFWENRRRFLGASLSWSIRKFFRVDIFIFWAWAEKVLGYKYRNIRHYLIVPFFRENMYFFNIRARKFHFLKYRGFFCLFCFLFFFKGN